MKSAERGIGSNELTRTSLAVRRPGLLARLTAATPPGCVWSRSWRGRFPAPSRRSLLARWRTRRWAGSTTNARDDQHFGLARGGFDDRGSLQHGGHPYTTAVDFGFEIGKEISSSRPSRRCRAEPAQRGSTAPRLRVLARNPCSYAIPDHEHHQPNPATGVDTPGDTQQVRTRGPRPAQLEKMAGPDRGGD